MSLPRFVLHYAPRSRAFRILWLLEEARVPYELAVYDLQKGTHKDRAYLAVNPDGKVPALVDRGPNGDWSVIITESAAISTYIADACPEAALAPALSSPDRGPYLTWLIYCSAALEPAFADFMFPRQKEAPRSAVGWPSYDATLGRIERAVERGPWLLGEHFTAADVMLGAMLQWLNAWGKLPPSKAIERYLGSLDQRDGLLRAQAKEAEISSRPA
ncbi:MAG TPA: glutathione S-transferase family protein [Polyangiaceae bacterium]|nr:glutathione S-transferase family protein [Polyangiaceae bacterium]